MLVSTSNPAGAGVALAFSVSRVLCGTFATAGPFAISSVSIQLSQCHAPFVTWHRVRSFHDSHYDEESMQACSHADRADQPNTSTIGNLCTTSSIQEQHTQLHSALHGFPSMHAGIARHDCDHKRSMKATLHATLAAAHHMQPSRLLCFTSKAGLHSASTPNSREPQPPTSTEEQHGQHGVTAMENNTASSMPTTDMPPAMQLLYKWAHGGQGRVKGFTRKLLLRQVNRRIVARMARRATIGIPVVGIYFATGLMVRDAGRVRREIAGKQYTVASLFTAALTCDVLDITASAIIVNSIATRNFNVGLELLMPFAISSDKYALWLAASSFTCGMLGELLTAWRENPEHTIVPVDK